MNKQILFKPKAIKGTIVIDRDAHGNMVSREVLFDEKRYEVMNKYNEIIKELWQKQKYGIVCESNRKKDNAYYLLSDDEFIKKVQELTELIEIYRNRI